MRTQNANFQENRVETQKITDAYTKSESSTLRFFIFFEFKLVFLCIYELAKTSSLASRIIESVRIVLIPYIPVSFDKIP